MDNHMSVANKPESSKLAYLSAVKELILHYNRAPELCSVDEIKSFLIFQRDKLNLSSSTLNLRVCGLKYYFREVVARLDLVVRIPNPRIQKYDIDILSVDELKLLFQSCRDQRQFLILNILYETGMRSLELTRLQPQNFNKNDGTLIIRNSKGQKTRTLEYGQELRNVLNQYCKVRGGVPTNTLIDSYKEEGVPLTIRGLQHIVKEVTRRSGIKKKITPHSFRHTFAVHYLNRGGSIFRLQLLLGHEHLTTTLNYLKYASLPDGNRISILDILKGEKQ